MGQQQVQQPGTSREQKQRRKGFSRRQRLIATIVVALIVALVIATAQVLSGAKIIPDIWATISNAIVGTFGMIFAFFALIPLLFAPEDQQPASATATLAPSSSPAVASPQPIIIQLQQPISPQPLPPPILQPPVEVKPVSGNITGSFPPTDPKTIQQRHELVEKVYAELTKPDINCVVLTGIGGIGKSTAAALVYKYAEKQRKDGKDPFVAEALWITVEETTATFAYLAETISAVLGKPLADFGKLPPQNQAAALFNVLNTIDHSCLIVINQFENLLDSQTGQANEPGLGEWLDILNSRLCRCRVLLTSRPMPLGTQDYPPTHMQEYPVAGLATNEGMDLLRKQGVQTTQATDAELRTAVVRCAGHALSLELLASILRRNQSLNLNSLFNNPIYAQLWTGDIARKLLDYIYEQQLDDVQRQLLRAFSVYREPVPVEAVQDLLEATALQTQVLDALNVLLSQHLLQDSGKECYQLHAIVAAYARRRFDERDEQANKQALRAAHTKAAKYYLQQASVSCPPREKRRKVNDVKPLIEAAWQYCQAGQQQEAYDLVRKEGIYADLKRWGGNATLLELYQLLLPSDEWRPERPQVARIYRDLGFIYGDLGQKKRAQESYEESLRLYREMGDRGGEGSVLNNLGWVYDGLGKNKEALQYYKDALGIHREVGDRREEGRALNNLGGVYDALGKKQEALSYFEQALAIRQEVGDRGGDGMTLWDMGALYFEQGHYNVALASLLLARDIFEEVQSPNRDGVQSWIDGLHKEIGEQQFTTLLAQVEQQALQIVERALHEGL
jgi:tetratricopeptide (TPR) repeat protein